MSPIKRIFGYSQLIGINIVLYNDEYKAFFCQLNKIKGQLTIDRFGKIENIQAFEFDKNLPVVINICGKGILTKKVASTIETPNEALSVILPNANEQEFYIQLFQEENSFCSIARKNSIDNLLQNTSFYPNIVSLSFEAFSLINIIDLINGNINNNYNILSGIYDFHFKDSSLQSIELNDESFEYNIDGFSLSSYELVAFSVAFQNFENENVIKINEVFLENESDFFYKRIFDKSIKIIPIIFLVLLLFNFVLMLNLEKKYNFFNNQIFLNQKILDEIEELNAEVIAKESFFKNEDWFSTSMTSFYADRIAFFLPDEISLTSLLIHPQLNQNNVTEKKLQFNYNAIELNALTTNAVSVAEWVKDMKKEKFIKDIEIVEYTQSEVKGNIAFKAYITLE